MNCYLKYTWNLMSYSERTKWASNWNGCEGNGRGTHSHTQSNRERENVLFKWAHFSLINSLFRLLFCCFSARSLSPLTLCSSECVWVSASAHKRVSLTFHHCIWLSWSSGCSGFYALLLFSHEICLCVRVWSISCSMHSHFDGVT